MTFMKGVDKNDITKSIEKNIYNPRWECKLWNFLSFCQAERPGELLSVYRECLLSPSFPRVGVLPAGQEWALAPVQHLLPR